MIPALGRRRQADQFKSVLCYTVFPRLSYLRPWLKKRELAWPPDGAVGKAAAKPG